MRDFLVPPEQAVRLAPPGREAREWVFVREDADGVGIGVYVHPDDLAQLEGLEPAAALDQALGAWSALTEGVSHFLLLFRRAARDEEVSMLELEAQAEVDKVVTATLVLGGSPGASRQARERILRDARLADGLGEDERERYTLAGRFADRYCARLEGLRDVPARLEELRRFYRRPAHARMELLRRAA